MPAAAQAPSIRGWLLVPFALLGLWCSWGLVAAMRYLPTWIARTLAYGPGPGLEHPAFVLPGLVVLAFSFYVFVCFLLRKRHTRAAMILLCTAMLVLLVALYVLPPHLVRGGPAILAAGTLLYFVYSKRVKATFVR